MGEVQTLRPEDGAQPETGPEAGGVDRITRSGMYLLYAGIAVSTAMLFAPGGTNHILDPIIKGFLHIESPAMPSAELAVCEALGVKVSALSSAGMLAQFLWLLGAALLCIQPLKTKAWAFFIFEASMVLASLLPLLDMPFVSTVVLRVFFTIFVVIALACVANDVSLWKCILPWNWGRVWRGQMGDTALAILGSEILCWGYSMFGVNPALAWLSLVLGSVVMMRFGWSGMRSGVKIAVAWYHLNAVYVVAGLIQLAWLLKAWVQTV